MWLWFDILSLPARVPYVGSVGDELLRCLSS